MSHEPAPVAMAVGRRRLLMSVAASCVWRTASGASVLSQEAVRRRLRFTLTFRNGFGHDLHDQAFWGYLPANTRAGQRLLSAAVSTEHVLSEDAWGHSILHLRLSRLAAYGSKVVTITADTLLDAAERKQALAAPATWLAAEQYIESDDPGLQQMASTLRRADDTQTARAIYDWVRTNINYSGYVAGDLGAVYALTAKRGDCTEYADLVVALARANGIASRMVGGFVVDRDATLAPQDYHNWAELHLNGAWCVVDAQKQAWLSGAGQYVAFRIYRDAASNPIGLAHRYRVQGDMTVSDGLR